MYDQEYIHVRSNCQSGTLIIGFALLAPFEDIDRVTKTADRKGYERPLSEPPTMIMLRGFPLAMSWTYDLCVTLNVSSITTLDLSSGSLRRPTLQTLGLQDHRSAHPDLFAYMQSYFGEVTEKLLRRRSRPSLASRMNQKLDHSPQNCASTNFCRQIYLPGKNY
jgi:hypothetical protein